MGDGITRIAVEGFKSIAKRQEIEIRPLTILAGANSSGKSSIMQPLLMLKQTLDAEYDPGPLKIDGPNVRFTSSEQFLTKEGRPQDRLRAMVSASGVDFTVAFAKIPKGGLTVEHNIFRVSGESLTLRPRMSAGDLQSALKDFRPTQQFSEFDGFEVRQNRFLMDVKNGPWPLPLITREQLAPYIQEVIHVPGLRGNPSRTYKVAATGPSFPGTFEHYVASVISRWQLEGQERYRSLNQDLDRIGLARMVEARLINETEIELRVNRVQNGKAGDLVSLADVGFGVSQTLPVLVALQAADEGRMVYLEEPEIHLHPLAQTKLAEVLADAAKRGVRVVAETHSSLLLTAIQTLVAKGEVPPDLVKLYWFQRDPETGNTQISPGELDKNGAFGDWPEDFDAVALDAEGAYLDAVESHRVP
jgi:predicted ATPase